MLRGAIFLALALALTGCSGLRDRLNIFKGRDSTERSLPYKAKLSKNKADPRDLTITVASRGDGLEEVRESVRFQATKYCLKTFGSSDADWQIDPETGDWAYTSSADTLTFQGRCTGR